MAWRLALYPLVFVFSWMAPCVNYLLEIWDKNLPENFGFEMFVALAYGEGGCEVLAAFACGALMAALHACQRGLYFHCICRHGEMADEACGFMPLFVIEQGRLFSLSFFVEQGRIF